MNRDIEIRDNRFRDNAAYNIILYDGERAVVKGNILGPNAARTSVGVAISPGFRRGAVVMDNVFDGSKLAVDQEVLLAGNRMNDSVVSLIGHGITIDGMTFTGSILKLRSDTPNGISASGLEFTGSKGKASGLVLDGKPLRLTNLSFNGESAGSPLSGSVEDGSVFDNLSVTGYVNGLSLLPGTYTNCTFEAGAGGSPSPTVNRSGRYRLESCTITAKNAPALLVNVDKAEVEVTGSRLTVLGAQNGDTAIVKADRAASLVLTGNTLTATDLVSRTLAAIRLRSVPHAAVTGNVITTNLAVKPVDASGGGIDMGDNKISVQSGN